MQAGTHTSTPAGTQTGTQARSQARKHAESHTTRTAQTLTDTRTRTHGARLDGAASLDYLEAAEADRVEVAVEEPQAEVVAVGGGSRATRWRMGEPFLSTPTNVVVRPRMGLARNLVKS